VSATAGLASASAPAALQARRRDKGSALRI